MYIKKYDLYKFGYDYSFFVSLRIEEDDYLYPISSLLDEIYPYDVAVGYEKMIQNSQAFMRIGIFEDVEITLDAENNLIYLSDAYDDDYRIRTKNLTQAMIIEFCKNGSLHHRIMTKLNFIHLVSAWAKLLENEPSFALFYLDDKDWYDVLSFDLQEAMEKFVADHTQSEATQK